MQVPMLDLHIPFRAQEPEIRAAIDRVLESQGFINGPEVDAFEREVEAFLGHPGVEAVGCSNGSAALLLAMMALGVGPGDEVIVPTYSFFSTVSCVTLVGATPVFVDIEPDTLNMDPAAVAGALSDRTKAIIPVHLFGRAADLPRIDAAIAAAGRAGQVKVVEDAAQALSARLGGRRVCTFGALSTVSFYPSKNLGGFGDGGMVLGTDPEAIDAVRVLSRHGARAKYHHELVGINSRLDALQAAVLRVRLTALDDWSQQRRDNAERYRALFEQAGLGGFVRLPAGDGPDGVFHHIYNQFNLRVARRDELQAHLKAAGVGTVIYYPVPLHLQPCFAHLGGAPGSHPISEAAAADSLAIPIFPGLTEAQQSYVIEQIAAFYRGGAA